MTTILAALHPSAERPPVPASGTPTRFNTPMGRGQSRRESKREAAGALAAADRGAVAGPHEQAAVVPPRRLIAYDAPRTLRAAPPPRGSAAALAGSPSSTRLRVIVRRHARRGRAPRRGRAGPRRCRRSTRTGSSGIQCAARRWPAGRPATSRGRGSGAGAEVDRRRRRSRSPDLQRALEPPLDRPAEVGQLVAQQHDLLERPARRAARPSSGARKNRLVIADPVARHRVDRHRQREHAAAAVATMARLRSPIGRRSASARRTCR